MIAAFKETPLPNLMIKRRDKYKTKGSHVFIYSFKKTNIKKYIVTATPFFLFFFLNYTWNELILIYSVILKNY